jgi:hypothetical protein
MNNIDFYIDHVKCNDPIEIEILKIFLDKKIVLITKNIYIIGYRKYSETLFTIMIYEINHKGSEQKIFIEKYKDLYNLRRNFKINNLLNKL